MRRALDKLSISRHTLGISTLRPPTSHLALATCYLPPWSSRTPPTSTSAQPNRLPRLSSCLSWSLSRDHAYPELIPGVILDKPYPYLSEAYPGGLSGILRKVLENCCITCCLILAYPWVYPGLSHDIYICSLTVFSRVLPYPEGLSWICLIRCLSRGIILDKPYPCLSDAYPGGISLDKPYPGLSRGLVFAFLFSRAGFGLSRVILAYPNFF